jgi:hypothetical protein
MVTICFYTPKSYEKLKKVADDKQNLCNTYAEWLVEFTKLMNAFRDQGLQPTPLTVNIDDLLKWCKDNKCKNTGESRARYAQEMGRLLEQIRMN